MGSIGGAFYKKVYEDDLVVRYGFSNDPPTLRRTMTLTKADNRCVPDDGEADHEFRAAASGVARDLRATSEYPQSGTWISH
jgi:hypothetical protein